MYLPGKGGKALIERKLHIVDDLIAKALIGIDIIKPKGIILDPARDIMTVASCKNLEVPIMSSSQRPQTRATIFSNNKKILTIPPHSNVAVPVAGPKHQRLQLPHDRDLIFEPQKLDTLSVYAHLVDHEMSSVFIRNDTDFPISLPCKAKLDVVIDIEAAGCFAVDSSQHDLAARSLKRSPKWIKSGLRKLVAAIAAFTIATTASPTEETHTTGVIIHGTPEAKASIAAAVTDFSSL